MAGAEAARQARGRGAEVDQRTDTETPPAGAEEAAAPIERTRESAPAAPSADGAPPGAGAPDAPLGSLPRAAGGGAGGVAAPDVIVHPSARVAAAADHAPSLPAADETGPAPPPAAPLPEPPAADEAPAEAAAAEPAADEPLPDPAAPLPARPAEAAEAPAEVPADATVEAAAVEPPPVSPAAPAAELPHPAPEEPPAPAAEEPPPAAPAAPAADAPLPDASRRAEALLVRSLPPVPMPAPLPRSEPPPARAEAAVPAPPPSWPPPGIAHEPPPPALPLPAPPLPDRGAVRRGLWLAARAAGALLGVLAVAVLGLAVLYRWVDPPASTLMLGQRLAGMPIRQRWVPLERISPNLRLAVVLSEDARFCQHGGVDWGELREAIEQVREGGARGGSTISMQVVKNLFLWPSRSYLRKAIEIPLALLVEALWSKRRILEIYLNIAEWGPGVFGAEAAARFHFRKPASQLAPREAALLAVALPNPFEREAGSPGPGTSRLADHLLVRMRAGSAAAACVRGPAGLGPG